MQFKKGHWPNLRPACVPVAFACFLIFCVVSCRQSPKVEDVMISNTEPRRDTNGRIIDAHGGCLQLFNGRFYLYGSAFGTNQSYNAWNCPFAVYSSPDLKDWTFEGHLLKNPPNGVYYRPYVVFNPNTRKFVLWYNWYPTLWNGQAGVAVSESPTGPFTVVTPKAHLLGASPGDGSLFVDDDGKGYYIYTDIAKDYAIRVELLTPDFLDSSNKSSNVMATGVEAPTMFRRGNIYYALCGPLCSTSPKGSEVQVFTSDSPLGPFSTHLSANINRSNETNLVPASAEDANHLSLMAGKKDWRTFQPQSSVPVIPAQQTWVTTISAGDQSVYLWIGDRWGSNPDGSISHDFQFWSPLEFTADGRILPLKPLPQWTIIRAFYQ